MFGDDSQMRRHLYSRGRHGDTTTFGMLALGSDWIIRVGNSPNASTKIDRQTGCLHLSEKVIHALDSRGNKYQLMAKSRLSPQCLSPKLLSNLTYLLARLGTIAFGVLVSTRASF